MSSVYWTESTPPRIRMSESQRRWLAQALLHSCVAMNCPREGATRFSVCASSDVRTFVAVWVISEADDRLMESPHGEQDVRGFHTQPQSPARALLQTYRRRAGYRAHRGEYL